MQSRLNCRFITNSIRIYYFNITRWPIKSIIIQTQTIKSQFCKQAASVVTLLPSKTRSFNVVRIKINHIMKPENVFPF